MSDMTRCPSCAAALSRTATACPKCGHRFPRKTTWVTWTCSVVIVFFALACGLAALGIRR